mgnify:CR=1 FL=1
MQDARINRFVAGLIAIVLGALMIAEGVLGWVTDQSLFYSGVNPSFKFAVGFIVIVLAAHLLEKE